MDLKRRVAELEASMGGASDDYRVLDLLGHLDEPAARAEAEKLLAAGVRTNGSRMDEVLACLLYAENHQGEDDAPPATIQ